MLHAKFKGISGTLALSAVAAACMAAGPAWAKSDYPSRPITLITPYSTGGDWLFIINGGQRHSLDLFLRRNTFNGSNADVPSKFYLRNQRSSN